MQCRIGPVGPDPHGPPPGQTPSGSVFLIKKIFLSTCSALCACAPNGQLVRMRANGTPFPYAQGGRGGRRGALVSSPGGPRAPQSDPACVRHKESVYKKIFFWYYTPIRLKI